MGRPRRVTAGGLIYHVLNRGNARKTIFDKPADYEAFERVLAAGLERYPGVRLLAYVLMPNHWHLILWPTNDGELSAFVGWVTLTHTQRWHAHRHTTGEGHLYGSRFKSFIVQDDAHFYTVVRYVERNPLRAGLVEEAKAWRYGSLHRWAVGRDDGLSLLADWPTIRGQRGRPADWPERVDQPLTLAETEALGTCITRGRPYGTPAWTDFIVAKLGLAATLRPRGRPRKADVDEKGS